MPTYLPFVVTAATLALNASTHGTPAVVVVNRAAGSTLVLPAAYGSGAEFDIMVGTTMTSNNLIIQVANSSDVMTGQCVMLQDAGDTVAGFETAADTDTITMNGSTKGGIRGDRIRLKDIANNTWQVQVIAAGTGTEVTPFSAAV
ncbi:hypothetical protein [Agrobacterium sp. OT33]|uniref:hypothetical protein n=1 Tax=Agrobacterium sp. OT33 TaxID=2815338 RepID=UPI001A8CAA15|nr:hypothetical protein [Agrobacterium sp. OT33]MBO0125119.1 hypothetical protein [Agrobacterium sp. OT33]